MSKFVTKQSEIEETGILLPPKHDSYYFYTDHVDSLMNPLEMFFGLVSSDRNNDPQETTPEMEGYVCFCRCLSYFQSENVAMWKMYADKRKEGSSKEITNEKGICFRYTSSIIGKFAEKVCNLSIVFKNKKGTSTRYDAKELVKNEKLRIKLRNVVYYKKTGHGNLLLRSTHKAIVSDEIFESVSLKNPMKNICWSYETEAKLYCYLSDSFLKGIAGRKPITDVIDGIVITFKNDERTSIRIRRHPEEKNGLNPQIHYDKNVQIEDSELKGHVRLEANQSKKEE